MITLALIFLNPLIKILLLEINLETGAALLVAVGSVVVLFLKNLTSIPGFTVSRPKPIYLKKGESVIVHSWKWWPPGWTKILYSANKDGDTDVHYL